MHWVVTKEDGVLVYLCRTTVGSLLLTLVCAIPFATQDAVGPAPEVTLTWAVVSSLLVAPLFENLCMIGLAEFLGALGWPLARIVTGVGLAAAAIHLSRGMTGGIAGFFGFATMTLTYYRWRERSVAQRYLITVFQHALLNLLPVAAFIALDP